MFILATITRSANRTLGVVSKTMNQAQSGGLRPHRTNPYCDARQYEEKKRERFLTADQACKALTGLLASPCSARSRKLGYAVSIQMPNTDQKRVIGSGIYLDTGGK